MATMRVAMISSRVVDISILFPCSEIAAGLAHDQFGLIDDLLMLMRFWIVRLVEQEFSGGATEQVHGLTHRCEGSREHAGKINVVVANQGEIAGNREATSG